MLHLTPFEETTVGKQIYGRGVQQGLSQGELIGKIQFAQKILRHPSARRKSCLPNLTKNSAKCCRSWMLNWKAF